MRVFMKNFDMRRLSSICDICGKPRTKGQGAANHRKCSKLRQQMNIAKRAS